MKIAGSFCRIDESGRIIIPREIRKALGISEGDFLEILVGSGGKIILRKYPPIADLSPIQRLWPIQ